MNTFTSSKKSALLAGLCFAVLAAAGSSAIAMPAGGVSAANGSSSMLMRAADQHRTYPGADSAAADSARAQKMAPNLFCDKHENLCH